MNDLRENGPDLALFPDTAQEHRAMVLRTPLFPMLTGTASAVISENDPDLPIEGVLHMATDMMLRAIGNSLQFEGEDKELYGVKLLDRLKEDTNLLPDWFDRAYDRMIRQILKFNDLPRGSDVQYLVSYIGGEFLCIVYQMDKRTLQ